HTPCPRPRSPLSLHDALPISRHCPALFVTKKTCALPLFATGTWPVATVRQCLPACRCTRKPTGTDGRRGLSLAVSNVFVTRWPCRRPLPPARAETERSGATPTIRSLLSEDA